MDEPLVSIGIPTYNRADSYFPLALHSAVQQTYPSIEIVVGDNGSRDGTGDLVRSLADRRVRYFRHQPSLSPNENFNFCLQQARGRYFLLLHDDDLIDADFVQCCMQAAQGLEPAVIRTGTRIVDGGGRVLREVPNRTAGLSTEDFFLGWFGGLTEPYLCSTLFHTAQLRAAGGFHSRHNLFQDVVALVELAARGGRVDVPEIKASFRRHGGSITSRTAVTQWCEDALYLLDRMVELAPNKKSEIRARGMRSLAYINYGRAIETGMAVERLRAFWTVYRAFGFRHSPGRFLFNRKLLRPLRQVKRRVLAG